jgi:hypothetical protein
MTSVTPPVVANANASALGFVIKVDGATAPSLDDGWWARVKDGAAEFSFGPCANPERAKTAAEAFLRRAPLPPGSFPTSPRASFTGPKGKPAASDVRPGWTKPVHQPPVRQHQHAEP